MILVTGGTGLVGSHLLYHLLLKNDSVRAIHQRNSDLNAVKRVFTYYSSEADYLFNKIRWVEASLEDIPDLDAAFENISQVYHCAAMVSFKGSEYKKMRRVNIDGTTNIVNLCISHQVEKLCFVSSVAAIENGAPGVVMDESDNWSNSSDKSGYSITKYGAEMEVWRASQEGVPVVIVNPGIIIGPGFWHKGSGAMFSKIKKGLKFYTTGITGFVGVNDVVRIMEHLMNSEIINQRYVIVSDNLSYQEVFSFIASALKRPQPSIRITKFLSECIWRLEYVRSKLTLSPPLLTKRTARSALANHPYTAEKIRNKIGFEFEPVKDCIEQTAACLTPST